MKIILTRTLLLPLLLAFQLLNAQNPALDSLQSKLSGQPDDTTKVNLLNRISSEMLYIGDLFGSESKAKEALVLAEKLDYKEGLAVAYYSLGRLEMDKENYPQALQRFMQSLSINEQLGNKKETARNMMTIANVYAMMSDNAKALSYYQKAEQIAVGLTDQQMLESLYLNMSNVYISQGNHDEGMRCCLKAKNEAIKKGDKRGEARVYSSIGKIWEGENNYAEALKSYNDANKIYEEMGYKQGQTIVAVYIGNIYSKQRNYAEALKYHQQAEKLASETGDMVSMRNILKAIADDYEKTGKTEAALAYFKRYQAVNDSVQHAEFLEKLLRLELRFEVEKKEAELRKMEGKMKDRSEELLSEKVSMQSIKGNPTSMILIGALVVVSLAFIIYIVVSRQNISELRRQAEQAQFNNTGGRKYP